MQVHPIRFLECSNFTVSLLIKYVQHKSATVLNAGSQSDVSGI